MHISLSFIAHWVLIIVPVLMVFATLLNPKHHVGWSVVLLLICLVPISYVVLVLTGSRSSFALHPTYKIILIFSLALTAFPSIFLVKRKLLKTQFTIAFGLLVLLYLLPIYGHDSLTGEYHQHNIWVEHVH